VSFPSLQSTRLGFSEARKTLFKSSTSKFLPQNLSQIKTPKIVFNKNKDVMRAPNVLNALGLNKIHALEPRESINIGAIKERMK